MMCDIVAAVACVGDPYFIGYKPIEKPVCLPRAVASSTIRSSGQCASHVA